MTRLIKRSAILFCLLALAMPLALDAADEKIIIGGAQSLTAPADKFSTLFRNRYPGLEIEIRRSNSNYAVHATLTGEVHIGLVARNLSRAEKSKLYAKSIGHDAVMILSHPENSVSDLSLDELRNIYLGNITHWREVGGGDLLLGRGVMEREKGWNLLCKFFDNLGAIPHHMHQSEAQAQLLGRRGKPEAYYFPPQYNQTFNNFPHTFMGLEPGTTKADVRKCLENWNRGDNGITYLSRAYRLEPGTGWPADPLNTCFRNTSTAALAATVSVTFRARWMLRRRTAMSRQSGCPHR
jgi:hypothetical protein